MSSAPAECRERPAKKRKIKTIFFNTTDCQYPAVPRCGKRLGWKVTDSTVKNLLFWVDNNVGIEFCLSLQPWQFVNHFPGTYAISRKVELSRSYDRAQRLFPNLYNFHPLSFILPTQNLDLQRYMRGATLKKRTFIVKPDLGAQGRGIFLVMDPEEMNGYTESAIAQQYIAPCLLEGLKFDFRIYALISSIDPLRIYIFREGMTRFCTEPYRKPRPNNLSEVFRHLTNYSVNKKNEHFQQPSNAEHPDTGHKRSLSSVFKELEENGHNIAALQEKIDKLIILTIMAVQPFIAHNYKTGIKVSDGKSRCFEILGFDVMIDKNMKPWLLEVNHSPSFLCESPFDKQLKDDVITGALRILNLDPSFKKKTTAYERVKAAERLTGQASSRPDVKLWNPEKESEIADEQTQWRQIFPNRENPELQSELEAVLSGIRDLPLDGAGDTAASQRRREAIQTQMQKKEEPKPEKKRPIAKQMGPKILKPKQPGSGVSRTPRSVLLKSEVKREEPARRQVARRMVQEDPFAQDPQFARNPHVATNRVVLEFGL